MLLRSSPLHGLGWLSAAEAATVRPDTDFVDVRLRPQYPSRSPLEDVLRLVTPGLDEYETELWAHEIHSVLAGWAEGLRTGNVGALRSSLHTSLMASPFHPTNEKPLRTGGNVQTFRCEFSAPRSIAPDYFLRELTDWLGAGVRVQSADFEITAIAAVQTSPLTVATTVRYSIVTAAAALREQHVGTWKMIWTESLRAGGAASWGLVRLAAQTASRSVACGTTFADITEKALGNIPLYNAQMVYGADHWRTVLDGACGIDVYGNNGIAAGDFDNDGHDDLYICQPAGLPNRLYRNHGNGTFTDVTEAAGVNVLDNSACAIFADFRNVGLQDLLVVCGTGPLLFVNQGDGTFQRRRDAFRFAQPPQGTFTHAAVADYDRDGRLDIYFCLYSYYLGLDKYHYPAPYFDARNGPPNYLLHNEGDGTFVDRTEAAGLRVENDRYSFACAWGESGAPGAPDLYVVNDFGRNNLYRNQGDGTFKAVSKASQAEDVGAGMSASWVDYNNDGRADLYVANMWSAAGQRISGQASFHADAPESVRALYKRHARGNALYRNRDDGTFENVSAAAGVEMGRWAWCSEAWDFDHDGFSDLYVTNGYITAPTRVADTSTAANTSLPAEAPDLASFFWRQIVAKSPNDATPSLAYERGWNALNELIRSDGTWSGRERNVMLANNRDGTFSEVAGVLGLDFLEDGRSFALADLDGDGRLEVVLKNRNAPQLRILRNTLEHTGASVAFRLIGTKSNRDAIGAAVTVTAGDLKQTKYLQAGTGFLSQHTKELHFGLGQTTDNVQATIRWPSGLTQTLGNLPRNARLVVREDVNSNGSAAYTTTPFPSFTPPDTSVIATSPSSEPTLTSVGTWLIQPLQAPPFTLPDFEGQTHTLDTLLGSHTLLSFWTAEFSGSLEHLRALQQASQGMTKQKLNVVALHIEATPNDGGISATPVGAQRLSFPVLAATAEIAGIYNIVYRYLFDRRRDLPLPTSFLLDRDGMIIKVYAGSLPVAQLFRDVVDAPVTPAERVRKALPFPGTLYGGSFERNDFTYGIAMFQHGYYEQAAVSFRQVVAARPNDAEAYYNLGTLDLRRGRYPEATAYLQQALKLKPDYPEAWNNLGMMAAQQGRADEAVSHFRRSLELRPAYATALLNLGNVYRRKGAFTEAGECLKQALALQPDDPEVDYSLGMLYAQSGQVQSASQYLRRAVALRPDYPEALNNLGVLLVRQGKDTEAEQQFRICIRLAPRFEQSYLNLAHLLLAQHDPPGAKATLEDLLRLHPDSAAAKGALQTLALTP